MEAASPVSILLVEDNPADVRLTREALKQCRLINTLDVVMDGEAAMRFLRHEDEHRGAARPDLILLDLNLPLKSGQEVLAEIRADELLKIIPVVVLTSSKSGEDILGSYRLSCNCYVVKPVRFDQFSEVVRAIEEFWFTVAKLPKLN